MPICETVTHVAGPPVCIAGRVIQRCAVCGEKLTDSLNCMTILLNEDGTPPVFPTWAQRALVQVEGGNPTRYSVVGDFESDEPLPEDFCLALVE